MSYSVYKVTPDLAVRKTTGLFNAIATTSSGVVLWDFGDGQTQRANIANYTYPNNENIPFIINIINSETYNLIVGLDLASNELTAVDISRFENLTSLDISDNLLPAEELNKVLITLDNFGKLNGTLDYSGNLDEPNSYEALQAYENLVAKGWVITGNAPFTSFIFTVDTSKSGVTANNQFAIPLTGGGNYDLLINWGDNTPVENYIGTSGVTHTFPSVGVYTIKIKPNIWNGSFRFGNGGDKLKITNISQFSLQMPFNNCFEMFRGCSNLTITSNSEMKFISTSFYNIFQDCVSLTYEDFNLWDTSNVTTFVNAFRGCSNFDGYIDAWDTSNVTDMNAMFLGASKFNQPIGKWNTSKVTNMASVFYAANKFNQPVGNWDTSNATNMSGMFFNSSFDQDISNWDTSKVTDMTSMFYQGSFNQPIESWDVSKVTSMSAMFGYNRVFNQPLGNWDTSSLQNIARAFQDASSFNQDLSSWNVENVSNAQQLFDSSGFTTENYDLLLIGWEAQNVRNNVTFSAGNTKYTLGGAAEAARQRLITDHNWTIIDGGGI